MYMRCAWEWCTAGASFPSAVHELRHGQAPHPTDLSAQGMQLGIDKLPAVTHGHVLPVLGPYKVDVGDR